MLIVYVADKCQVTGVFVSRFHGILCVQITEMRREIANLKTTTSQSHTPENESTDAIRSLLVGTSIIKNVDEWKLKNTTVICLRGGHISDFRASLARLPTGTHYDRTVLDVGGNDCADERDSHEVVEMYRELDLILSSNK